MQDLDYLNAWDPEVAGARLVSQLEGGTAYRHDHNDGTSKHDFDISVSNNRAIALEVTQHVDSEREQQRGEIDKRDWDFPMLRQDWFADIVESARVGEMYKQLPNLLRQLETQGISDAGLGFTALRQPEIATNEIDRTLARLGVLNCRPYPAEAERGYIVLDTWNELTSFGVTTAAEAVRRHAWVRSDNRRKLGHASSANERHLFIWIDSATRPRVDIEVCHKRGELPNALPALPDEIDVVWLAVNFASPIVLRLNRDGWYPVPRIRDLVA
ncbi:hypothetical protein [Candidatus Poriferisodalis sp.]|uniref:hypothetical protein n=1 Tax=Candidatus Poriferisodalis sp. TaxID=3101277 RepID=UPI003B02C62D